MIEGFFYEINQIFHWQSYALIGIILEIFGFILMTFLWGIHPTISQWGKWRDAKGNYYGEWYANHMKGFSEKISWYKKSRHSYMYVDDIVKGDLDDKSLKIKYLMLPKKFQFYWNLRTKIPAILPVIVGLALQGYQIFFI
ncbi:MAG: hypothetical protein IIC67_06280 [Thaumarchaeota archaeon]|nr:hypothetical protein [Nitrososphaerota archaeon]